MPPDDDPLLAFVEAEAARIERELDAHFARNGDYLRYILPTTPAPPSDGRSFRWRYRYTWQEAERARRYVWRLPHDRALTARQATEGQIDAYLRAQLQSGANARTLPITISQPQITYRESLRAYEVSLEVRIGEPKRS